jgi:hypothetical protein
MEDDSMAEQTSTAPEKSAGDVRKSPARSDAEGSQGSSAQSKGSKYSASQEMTWGSPAVDGGEADTSEVHPLTGKSLEYTQGPGRENYAEGHYVTDSVNRLDHLAHAMVPRNQFD